MATSKKQPFAYVMFAIQWDDGAKRFLDERNGEIGGTFELLLSSEDSSQVEDYGKYERGFLKSWGLTVERIAVVQMTDGWDPRPDFIELLKANNAALLYSKMSPRRTPSVYPSTIVFSVPSGIQAAIASRVSESANQTIDAARFWHVVDGTAKIAADKTWSILLLAGPGWSYSMKVPADRVQLLRNAGFQFVDRHG